MAREPTARYIRPLSTNGNLRASATRRPTADLPEPAGPSMATINLLALSEGGIPPRGRSPWEPGSPTPPSLRRQARRVAGAASHPVAAGQAELARTRSWSAPGPGVPLLPACGAPAGSGPPELPA